MFGTARDTSLLPIYGLVLGTESYNEIYDVVLGCL